MLQNSHNGTDLHHIMAMVYHSSNNYMHALRPISCQHAHTL